jgi:hypothetical protein
MNRTIARIADFIPQPRSATAKIESIQKWNLILAIVVVLEGLLILLFSRAYQLPLQLSYLVKDNLASAVTGETVWASAVRTLGHVNLSWLLAFTLFLAAFMHLIMTTDLLRRKQPYEQSLRKGVAPLRWWAFGLTGGMAAVTVAMVSGVYVLTGLMLLGALLMAAASWGVRAERPRSSRLSWVAHVVTLAVAWLIVASYGFSAWMFGDGRLTGYVYAAVAILLVWFALVSLLTHVRRSRTSRLADGYLAEQVYQWITLVALTVLTWTIFAGALWA